MVEILLTGKFVRAVDEKRRIAIPKSIRDTLKSSNNSVLYIAPGTDVSLAIYTEEAFTRMADRLAAAPPTARDVRAFSRLFYAQASRVELDRMGRIRVPSELAESAELGKEAVMLGVGDHLELWNSERWATYEREQQAKYDEIAERALGGEGGISQ